MPGRHALARSPRLDRAFARLRRKTTGGRYLAEIDGLRFIAILSVLLFHSWLRSYEAVTKLSPFGYVGREPVGFDVYTRFASRGWLGVHVFFVISGFILALPFAAKYLATEPGPRLRSYFLRRLTRLEPPYLVALTLFALLWMTTDLWFPFQRTGTHYLYGLFYGHTLFLRFHNPINPPVWTLEIEFQFYVLLPLLAQVFRIRSGALRRGTLVAAMLWIAWIQPFSSVIPAVRVYTTVFDFLQYFLAGILFADMYITLWQQKPSRHWIWDPVAIVGWGLFFYVGGAIDRDVQRYVLPIVLVGLFAASFKGELTSSILRNRWIATTGGMCYTIYLLHTPIMWIVSHWAFGRLWHGLTTGSILAQTVLNLLVLAPIALLFYVLIERPCMEPDWPQRLMRRLGLCSFRREGAPPVLAAPAPTDPRHESDPTPTSSLDRRN